MMRWVLSKIIRYCSEQSSWKYRISCVVGALETLCNLFKWHIFYKSTKKLDPGTNQQRCECPIIHHGAEHAQRPGRCRILPWCRSQCSESLCVECHQNGCLRLVQGICHRSDGMEKKGRSNCLLFQFHCRIFHDLHRVSVWQNPNQSHESTNRQKDLQRISRLCRQNHQERRCRIPVAWFHPNVSTTSNRSQK